MKEKLVNALLRIFFYPSPKIAISDVEEHLFEDLYEKALKHPNKLIMYDLSIPKYKFLQYIAMNKPVVFHGSNNKTISSFEPREQTLFDGRMSKAVFATKDPIWCSFYAILNKNSIVGNIRNGSITANGKQVYHFYSLTGPTFANGPWKNGMVYFLPIDSFTHISKGIIQFDEWISKQSVNPIVKLEVEPNDFYFLDKVSRHNTNESLTKSWFSYKLRTLFKPSISK